MKHYAISHFTRIVMIYCSRVAITFLQHFPYSQTRFGQFISCNRVVVACNLSLPVTVSLHCMYVVTQPFRGYQIADTQNKNVESLRSTLVFQIWLTYSQEDPKTRSITQCSLLEQCPEVLFTVKGDINEKNGPVVSCGV